MMISGRPWGALAEYEARTDQGGERALEAGRHPAANGTKFGPASQGPTTPTTSPPRSRMKADGSHRPRTIAKYLGVSRATFVPVLGERHWIEALDANPGAWHIRGLGHQQKHLLLLMIAISCAPSWGRREKNSSGPFGAFVSEGLGHTVGCGFL